MDGVKKKSTEQMSMSSYVVINSYVLDTTLSDTFKRTFQQVRNRLLLFVVFCVWLYRGITLIIQACIQAQYQQTGLLQVTVLEELHFHSQTIAFIIE